MPGKAVVKEVRNLIAANEEVLRQGELRLRQRCSFWPQLSGPARQGAAGIPAPCPVAPTVAQLAGLGFKPRTAPRAHAPDGCSLPLPYWAASSALPSAHLHAGRVTVRDYDKIMEEYRNKLYQMRCWSCAVAPLRAHLGPGPSGALLVPILLASLPASPR